MFWDLGLPSHFLEESSRWQQNGPGVVFVFSPFGWQAAFIGKFEEDVTPQVRLADPAGCVGVVLCFLMVFLI